MPENEAGRDLNIEALRARAYQREAEAVREDLVRYLQEGVGAGEIFSMLRPVVRQALDEILKEALADERFQERIGRHVTDRVLAGLARELQVAQAEILQQVKAEMVAVWRRDAAAVLRQGIEEALKKQPFQEMIFRTPPAVSPAQEAEEVSPPVGPTSRQWPRFRIRWTRSVWGRFQWHVLVGGAVVLLLLSSVVIFELSRRSPNQVSAPQVRLPSSNVLPEEVIDSESLLRTWTELMVETEKRLPRYTPLLESLDHRSSSHFTCWFPTSTISALEEIRSAGRGLSEGAFQEKLVGAFEPCVSQYYSQPGERLVVLSAQAAVGKLLERREGSLQELPRLLPDGLTGNVTVHLLNSFLEDEGLYPHFRITRDPNPEGYLFALYLALKELESGA